VDRFQTIVIVGASGYIGSLLSKALRSDGKKVVGVSRTKKGEDWRKYEKGCLDGADVVFNFAGLPVDQRWTTEVKKKLVSSRIEVSDQIVDWISDMPESERPKAYLCASGIGVEGAASSSDDLLNAYGAAFLVQLCGAWEASAQRAEKVGVRVVNLRFGAVMGRGSKPWKKMSLPYKMFVGGPVGSKMGWFPWIHEKDAVEGMIHCMENTEIRGGVNFVAKAVTQVGLAKEMGKVLGRPSFFSVPPFMMKLMLGELADALMASIDAKSEKLDDSNYQWHYKTIAEALAEITSSETS